MVIQINIYIFDNLKEIALILGIKTRFNGFFNHFQKWRTYRMF